MFSMFSMFVLIRFFIIVVGIVVVFRIITNVTNGNHSSNNWMNDIRVKEDMERLHNQRFMDEMQRQQHQQFVDWSMEESRKSVTPFESGGYDMNNGNSFNDPHNGGF